MNATPLEERGGRRSVIVVLTSMLCAFLLLFTGAAPASATSAGIGGTQQENSTVWWGTARYNLNANNRMSYYYSWLSGGFTASMVVGARYPSTAVNSFAKTGTVWVGQTSAFAMVSNGSHAIPFGTFYLTTYLGWYGCPACTANWLGTLNYSIPY